MSPFFRARQNSPPMRTTTPTTPTPLIAASGMPSITTPPCSSAPAGDGRHPLLRRPPGIAERQAGGVVVVVPLHGGQPDHVAGAGDLHQRTGLDLPRLDPAPGLVVEDAAPHQRGAGRRLVVEVAQRLGAD